MYDISLWEKRLQEKYAERERVRQQVLAKAVEALRDYFAGKNVKAVYLTGSVLKEGRFHAFSDIDVAVEGFEGDYFRTLVELEALLDRDVDLIELEKCLFREQIIQRGLRVL